MVDLGIINGCNNNCIMCTRNSIDNYMPPYEEIIQQLNNLKDPDQITITGGEPTIRKDLIKILRFINIKFPETKIRLITDGRLLSYDKLILELTKIRNLSITSEIHGNEKLHDQITRVKGSFNQTLTGLKKALKNKIPVEMRIVLHKLNYKNILDICQIIKSELAGVERVVIFPIDYIGQAYKNRDQLFVSYEELKPFVQTAIDFLKEYFRVEIYHVPYCKLDERYHKYIAKKTVEERRLANLKECEDCKFRDICPGIWATYNPVKKKVNKNLVSIQKCKTYQEAKPKIRKALDLIGGLKSYISENSNVAIKPNILLPAQEENKASTTNSSFLKAVIEIIKEITPNVTVVECANEEEVKICGIKKVLIDTNTPFINLYNKEFVKKKVKNGYILKEITLPKCLDNFDVIINIPKLKTHPLTYLTCAVKNSYGFLDRKSKQKYHEIYKNKEDFARAVIDISNEVNPTLNIVDGIIAQENNGPLTGDPKNLGIILAGSNPHNIDIIASKITDYNIQEISTLKNYKELKEDLKNIRVMGENLKDCIDKSFVKSPFLKGTSETIRLKINKEKCTLCGLCKSRCPVKAINLKNQEINHDVCISCFCCLESCKNKAIERIN